MATRRNSKKTIGNLVREEVQKEPDSSNPAPTGSPDSSAEGAAPDETAERARSASPSADSAPGASSRSRKSRSASSPNATKASPAKTTGTQATDHPAGDETSKAVPKAASDPAAASQPSLTQLQSQLDQAQQQNISLEQQTRQLLEQIEHLKVQMTQESDRSQKLQEELKAAKKAAQQLAEANAALEAGKIVPQTTTALRTLAPKPLSRQALLGTGLRPAFSRPIVNRPVPWEVPRRPLVLAQSEASMPDTLSDDEIGWFD